LTEPSVLDGPDFPTLDPALIYAEQRAAHGRLHDVIYKMPAVYAAVIGGLWFLAATSLEKTPVISVGVFIFAAACAGAGALINLRLRVAGALLLDHLDAWEGKLRTPTDKGWLPRTTRVIAGLLMVASLISLMGAAYAATTVDEEQRPQTTISLSLG
jgi:hypothetical protein